MRNFLFLFTSLIFSNIVVAQFTQTIDSSPLDLAYYPHRYSENIKFDPASNFGNKSPIVRLMYSRPRVNGRKIFGSLVPFNELWRTGANETPEIRFYKKVSIGGKTIPAGIYSLMTIPSENEWTIILNSDLDQWGDYSYNQKLDIARIKAPSRKSNSTIENFTIQFERINNNTFIMYIGWEKTVVDIKILIL
jgi:Protein of unknown function (DUF2911)